MKKFVKKLTAGLLAFAMTVSTYSAAFAAPENTGDTAANTDVITISEEAENTLEAAKALSSLNANYGSSESDQDSGAKAAIKDAIFNDYNSTTDLSRYGISAGEMDSLVAEILGEKNMTEAVDVTYDTDDEGNVTTTEVEMDPMVTLAAEELAENAQVYGLSEEQSQELLGMYAQYLQLFEENADIFGVQVPYNTTRDTNANPIGSLLDVAGVPADAAQAGYVGYDVLSGIIQLYYLGTQFAVQEYADDIRAARDEALDAIKGAKTDMQEYLLLNAWLADNCQFNMAYIMKEMVEPEPAENELYTYAYNCMYNMIKQQVYDGTYNALKDIYGEDRAKAIAEQQAAAYMVDVQENGGSGEQQAASTASAIVGMWGSNQVGVFVQKKAVCFGYATVYAYLLQCAHPEIYTKDGKDITTASNWKSYKELNYELDSNGDPVKGEDGNYKWSKDSAAIADFVKIIFDADTSMFGQEASFGEAHYWNAVKLDGKWYYVDPCYIDIYVECMNRDRVETDGNMNHLYFLFSDDSCRKMYDGNIGELRTLYEGIATDQTYEDAWVAFIKSQPYKVDDRTYYFYDSTDLLDIMEQYGNGSSSNANSRASSDNSYEGLYNESEYKIVYHTDAQGDTSADFETLIDFNNGQVYNPSTKALEDNELIKELYAEHEEYVKEYPSIMISCAYYSNKIYFSLSNCVLSYDLKTGAVTKLIEYTEVNGKRDMTNGLGGLAFTMTSDDPGDNGITVKNPPIADMTISGGEMIVSVATNYAFISGKDFGELTDYSSYGYKFAETNYNPAYNTYYNNDEANDNDEFMWSANIVDTIDMSHLAGSSHSYSKVVDVPASCTEDGYSVNVCSTCGLIQEGTSTQASAQTLDAGEDEAVLSISITDGTEEGAKVVGTGELKHTRTAEEAEKESYEFSAGEIEEYVGTIDLNDGYVLDDNTYVAVDVMYGSPKDVSYAAKAKEVENKAATLNITVKAGEGESTKTVGTATMTSEVGPEGSDHTFEKEKIQETVESLTLEEGYVLSENTYEDVVVKYGASEDVSYAAKEAEKKAATLNITVKAGEGESAKTVGTTTMTSEVGPVGSDYTFEKGKIQETVESLTLEEGYVLSNNTYQDIVVKYGSSEDVSYAAEAKEVENKAATLNITVKAGEGESAKTVGTATMTSEVGPEGSDYTFEKEKIQETVESLTLEEGYVLSENTYEDIVVKYGASEDVSYAAKEAEKKAATLNITVKAGEGESAKTVGTTTMTSEVGPVGSDYTFAKEKIQETVEALTLEEGYVLSENTYEDVVVKYGASEDVSFAAAEVKKDVATLNITVKAGEGEDEKTVGSTTMTSEEFGPVGTEYTFGKEKIQETVEGLTLEEGYVLSNNTYEDINVEYGSSKDVSYAATQKDQAQATLIVKVYNTPTVPADPEEDEEEDTTGLIVEVPDTTSGYAGKTKDYTAEDIEGLVKEEVEAKGYTLDEIPEGTTYTVTYGDTEPVVVKLTATAGEGHTYIKFNETYYTKDSNNNWQKGTSYVCIDCGHAFELDEDDETVEENLRSNDKVLTDDEVSNYAKTKVWTWSTDRTEASMYTVPTDLKSHMFDCVWENSALSSREVATVKGDCETGEFTATLKSGETKTETVEKGHHSYLNQEEKDDDGKVTQEAAVQWSWADDCSSATVTFLCDVCGKETSVTVKQGDENMAAGDEVAPTCTEAGYITYTATVTVDDVNYISSRDLETEPAAGHNYKDGVCTECGAEQGNPFVDVSEDDYYYDAVLWAYNNGITSGTDATHFSPGDSCSRAQVVTFLWRTMGEPEPETTKNPFVDVSEETYYYKAVLWAVEQGITTGTDKTHFAPGNSATRSQFVTFLHRNEGEPKPESNENPFVDVSENEYYYDAVIWAYENGITTGTDETHFSPDKTCTRGQVVAFLYRTYGEEK